MKILFITPNDINQKTGGGINVKKIYLGLKLLKDNSLYIYSPSNVKESYFVANKNKVFDALSRIMFHSNYLYIDWKINKSKVLKCNPDVVILSNSRLGFIAEDIKKINGKIKILVQFDNIELDYCENYVEKYSGLKKIFIRLIEKISVYRDERKSLKYADKLIFLTNRDKERAHEVYKYLNNNEFILPICLEKESIDLISNEKKLNLIFLGSLWYPPNAKGITWFIKEVWNEICTDNMNLIIGGSRPSEEIKKYNGLNNIKVYPNFDSVKDIVPQNSVFISPIFEGAGMKVKVAEALSIGLPIIATGESLVGYEEVINDKFGDIIVKANSKDEFIEGINKFINLYNEELNNSAKSAFNKYYTINRTKKAFIELLNE